MAGSLHSSPLGSLPLLALQSVSRSPSAPTAASSSATDEPDNLEPLPFCEISPDMRREDERLKTFAEWPSSFVRPQHLAQAGFYYLGRGDKVRCAFCKVEIMLWVKGDDPATDHERWAPQCPLIQRLPTGNVPLGTDGAVDRRHESNGSPRPSPKSDIKTPGTANLRYASESSRLHSFKDWPKSLRQKPLDLAEAGFYYTGRGDTTKCFYCAVQLKDWSDDDVPWEEHARWFGRCAFLQLVKGPDYVHSVQVQSACIEPDESATQPAPATILPRDDEPASAPADDSKLCKICFVHECDVCFVPCGHVVACAKCALATNKCPVCRRTFTSAVRLYYS